MGDRNRGCFKSKEDQIQQLSKTVYVTNFPNHIRAQDLWNVCKDYGYVVDVYIPFKKSQVGKRFAFIRFIKVVNLIDNLCTIWFGSFHLHATIARFQSESKPTFYAEHNRANIRKKTFVEVSHKNSANTAPGKINFLSHVGAGSWFSSLQQPSYLFHTDERIAWIDIEGVPIMAWSSNTFTKITSKWGDLLYEDDKEDSCFHRKRVCIKTKMVENIFESFKIIVKGKVYWTRVKEVTGWNPDFMEEEDTQTESDNATIQSESDEERIPETVFENEKDSLNEAQSQNKESVKAQSEDPFNINDILNKKHENVIVGDRSQTADTLKYPPGFTPNNTTEANSNHDLPPNINSGENTMSQEDVVSNKPNHKPKEDGEVSACSGHFQKATTPRSQGSFLQFMEELVKVGHTMGYKMDGCIKNIEEIIEFQGVNEVNR
ncbi:RNA-directed DNA polymerase, eukaryota, reverse transcriptase zinc-binding domain protein [Tanacetum coccineum]